MGLRDRDQEEMFFRYETGLRFTACFLPSSIQAAEIRTEMEGRQKQKEVLSDLYHNSAIHSCQNQAQSAWEPIETSFFFHTFYEQQAKTLPLQKSFLVLGSRIQTTHFRLAHTLATAGCS